MALGTRASSCSLWMHQLPNGANCFSRCIGNGGMPVEVGSKHKPKNTTNKNDVSNRNLVIYDNRERKPDDGNINLGYNGYTILKLKNNILVIEYYDDNDNNQQRQTRKIIEEKWSLDKASGK